MDTLQSARQLIDSGRYVDALDALKDIQTGRDGRMVADVLRADLFERVGKMSQSRTLIGSLMRSSDLSDSQRSACEFVLSRLDWENGDIESSIEHARKAVLLA